MCKCVECGKEIKENYYNRCNACVILKSWDCKECGRHIDIKEYEYNKGKCNHCK